MWRLCSEESGRNPPHVSEEIEKIGTETKPRGHQNARLGVGWEYQYIQIDFPLRSVTFPGGGGTVLFRARMLCTATCTCFWEKKSGKSIRVCHCLQLRA
uniref:Uncharacterized protein n=1 Tax=Anopheles atroparvus TaxID=41427 RepID=A0AAG5DWN9_ANOAO